MYRVIKILFLLINIVNSYNSPQFTNNIARENFKLVPYYAKNYYKKHKLNQDQIDEIIQEGYVGLMRASRKYDINNKANAKFVTYATYWIKSYMTKCLKKMYKNINKTRDLNEDICKYYDNVGNYLDYGTLEPLERIILYRKYIKKPYDTSSQIAQDYGLTKYTLTKITKSGFKKLKENTKNYYYKIKDYILMGKSSQINSAFPFSSHAICNGITSTPDSTALLKASLYIGSTFDA